MPKKMLRGRPAADHLRDSFSSFNRKRNEDPDYAILRKGIPLGERAIGFDVDDLDRVILIKMCRRDGIADDQIGEEVERRLLALRIREREIEEAAKSARRGAKS